MNIDNDGYYWVAVNGATAAASKIRVSAERLTVMPTPQVLLGFTDYEEQQAAQRYLLTMPIKAVRSRLREWESSKEIKVVHPTNPEPPTTGQTLWAIKPLTTRN